MNRHRRPGFDMPRVPMSASTWALSERLRRAKEAAAAPLAPMLADPQLAHLSLTVEAGPPAVLVSAITVQGNSC